MFAIAIDDLRQDAMYLVRDRIGVKPLYVADDGTQACCLARRSRRCCLWCRPSGCA
jgi:asparagine synthetase B (glutamine-hydrolysing)